MAVQKAEVLGRLTAEQDAEVTGLEARIDARLRSDYVGRPLMIDISTWPHERVRHELERRYREAGWSLEFKSDQRDGEWIVVA